jgi:hypothetical protein
MAPWSVHTPVSLDLPQLVAQMRRRSKKKRASCSCQWCGKASRGVHVVSGAPPPRGFKEGAVMKFDMGRHGKEG